MYYYSAFGKNRYLINGFIINHMPATDAEKIIRLKQLGIKTKKAVIVRKDAIRREQVVTYYKQLLIY